MKPIDHRDFRCWSSNSKSRAMPPLAKRSPGMKVGGHKIQIINMIYSDDNVTKTTMLTFDALEPDYYCRYGIIELPKL